ncbi:MAG: DUF5610 domain-containing protein [Proteobacteria bacterium]|nr:DUF5610 domain-containing protein [Pseudomonadota bacterium]
MDIPVLGPKGAILTEQPQGKEKAEKSKENAPINVKAEVNSLILSSHEKLTFSIKNNELSLLYKSAVEQLNDILSPILGEEGLKDVEPDDYSPEVVAERIVQFSTAFFDSYKAKNPDLTEAEALDKFMAIIEGAIDVGIGEAVDILKGMNVLEGKVETDIERTYELIKEGLEKFRDSVTAQAETKEREETLI